MSGTGPSTFSVHAACLRGVEAFPVTVEVSLASGIPGISIVGLADSAVLDARVRMRCALRASGYELPRRSIVINLAPGDIRKTGSGLDLPMIIAILAISGQIPLDGLDGCLFVGELALDGSVLPVRGEVAYQLLARDTGLELVGALGAESVSLCGVAHWGIECISLLRSGIDMARRAVSGVSAEASRQPSCLDYADVVGQEMAKRGMAIAATGGLGMLMVGPPGSGKSMLAQRMGTILPEIDESEQQEALCIHSVAGEPIDGLLAGERPFRCPHHSISAAGLVGGGRPVRPGEISLAHGGVLFLDELAEFPVGVLQTLRQPLESGQVRIVRVDGAYVFPARFQLLAASNPCPCGYLGDSEVACTCSVAAVQRYQAKLAGPLIDRIDILVDVARPDPDLIIEGAEGLSSADLRKVVECGRDFKEWRMRRHGGEASGAGIEGLDPEGELTLKDIARRTHLGGRGIKRLARLARTIADMAKAEVVGAEHMFEASLYQGRRVLDAGS